mmetsp:Transcript_42031/g.80382  ORF Transcript_42031/g.80382 Transcript_42031/m.80382 type:complete len:168 (+) Transcript_42031:583-1086(+)
MISATLKLLTFKTWESEPGGNASFFSVQSCLGVRAGSLFLCLYGVVLATQFHTSHWNHCLDVVLHSPSCHPFAHLVFRNAPHHQVDEKNENVVYTEILRGDITVHNERVVHGSGPNDSAGWRRAYVLAFRKATTVAEERRHGFTHSHNDSFSWDEFHTWSERSKRQN